MANIILTNDVVISSDSILFNVVVPIDDGIEIKNPISLVQYDTSMAVICFRILKNNKTYVPPENAVINIRMLKPDKHEVYNPVAGIDSNGYVYAFVTAQMTASFGIGECCIEITENDNKKNTKSAPVYISKNPVSEQNIESTDEYKSLSELIAEAKELGQIITDNKEAIDGVYENIDAVTNVADNITFVQNDSNNMESIKTVANNASNMQSIINNLSAIQNASNNADRAEQAAEEAELYAQQSLGFRTFFSAVTPDENGDLDPSRPMTTPTAASVTIKSKGDRIQSVQVNGFTQQSGTGDPSPDNVREISAAGYNKKYQVPASGWSKDSANPSIFYNDTYPLTDVDEAVAIVSNLAQNVGQNFQNLSAFVSASSNFSYAIGFGLSGTVVPGRMYVKAPFSSAGDLQNWITANNGFLLYVTSEISQAAGLYIPIQAQGHEYRCQMLELTAPLCDGDKVESCVPSGCDKSVIFDGSSDENWQKSNGVAGNAYYIPVLDAAKNGRVLSTYAAFADNMTLFSSKTWLVSNGVSYNYIRLSSPIGSVSELKSYLQEHPLTVWYQSTSYAEQNDIPVELETHTFGVYTVTGAESLKAEWSDSSNPNLYAYKMHISFHMVNRSSEIIFSHFKTSTTLNIDRLSANAAMCSANALFFCFDGVSTAENAKAFFAAQYSAGTPVTVVVPLSTPAIYARDPVTLVAVPFTEADETAANQLANTPSTLPYIDSADVPMLLNKTTEAADAETAVEEIASTEVPPADATNAVHPMTMAAPLSTALPVAGTYVVSSQNGTTVQVSLKSMQDGGDAATLEGMTLDDIKKLISDMIAAAASGS